MVNNNTWSAQPLYGRDITQEMRNVNALQNTTVPRFTFASQFGSPGTGNGQFDEPRGLAFTSGGDLWICDSDNNRLQKSDIEGNYLAQFGSAGTGDGEFNNPVDVAIDSSGNLWVVDEGNNRVQKFSSEGAYQAQFGSTGSGNGEFRSPVGITITSAGDLWVTDSDNDRAQKFSGGVYQAQFGSAGIGNGQFVTIGDIVEDSSGNLWVTDAQADRVQKFNSLGAYQSQFNTGSAPFGLVFTSDGLLWIVFSGSSAVGGYTTAGILKSSFSTGSVPSRIAVASNGNLWVNNVTDNRIQEYQLTIPLSQTEFVKYTTGGTVSLGTPDGGVSVPALDALDSGAALVAPDHIIDIRTAIEALAPFYTNAITGNAFNWNGAQANSLYRIALGNRDTAPSDFGFSSPTPADDWQRTKIEMDNDPTYDIDIGEVALCIDKLQASVLE